MKLIKDFFVKLKQNKMLQTFIRLGIGVFIVLVLVLIGRDPANPYVIAGCFFVAGIVNINNGLKLMKRKKTRNQGMSMTMLGTIIIFIGIIAFRFFLT